MHYNILIKLESAVVLVSVVEAERTEPHASPSRGVEEERSGTRGTP